MITKFVLYDSTDDSVALRLDRDEVLLFDTEAEAMKVWCGYPEEVTNIEDLPMHHQEEILQEIIEEATRNNASAEEIANLIDYGNKLLQK